MKKTYTFLLTMVLAMVSLGTFAQNCIRIHNSDKTHNTFMKREIDNIKFSEDNQTQTITTKNGNTYDFDMAKVDSVSSFNINFLYNVVVKGDGSIFDKWWSPGWGDGESRVYIEFNRDGSVVWTTSDEGHTNKIYGNFDMDGNGTVHLYFHGFEAFRIVPKIITDDFFFGDFYAYDGDDGKFEQEESISMVRNIPGEWSVDYSYLTAHKWGGYESDDEDGVKETIATQFTADGKVKYYIDGKLVSTGTYTLDKKTNILTTKAVIDDEYEEVQYRVCNLTNRSLILFEIVTDYEEDPDGGEYTELRVID